VRADFCRVWVGAPRGSDNSGRREKKGTTLGKKKGRSFSPQTRKKVDGALTTLLTKGVKGGSRGGGEIRIDRGGEVQMGGESNSGPV